MAFGQHWEWRGFAAAAPDGRGDGTIDRVRALPLWFEKSQRVTDRYLWVPGCSLNLKLRCGRFKIKRRLARTEAGTEEWLENPAEEFEFPLAPDVFAEVAAALGIASSAAALPSARVENEEEFLERLTRAAPQLAVVSVEKRRWQHCGPPDGRVIVEYAEIQSPQDVVSIGVEDPDEARVRDAMAALGLPGGFLERGYLEALDDWGRGRPLR